MYLRGTILLVLVAGSVARPQSKPLTFEVADVKINNNPAAPRQVNLSNGRFIASNLQLRALIAEAWTITPDGVVGPSWLDDVRVDVAGDSGEAERPLRQEPERHSGMSPDTIGA
jgi:hypothetical protein